MSGEEKSDDKDSLILKAMVDMHASIILMYRVHTHALDSEKYEKYSDEFFKCVDSSLDSLTKLSELINDAQHRQA